MPVTCGGRDPVAWVVRSSMAPRGRGRREAQLPGTGKRGAGGGRPSEAQEVPAGGIVGNDLVIWLLVATVCKVVSD